MGLTEYLVPEAPADKNGKYHVIIFEKFELINCISFSVRGWRCSHLINFSLVNDV